jgi:hypothetical protein
MYFGNTTYFIPGADRYLQAVLSTRIMWWYIAQIAPGLRGGRWRFRLFTQYMETLPIAKPSSADRKKLSEIAEQCSTGFQPVAFPNDATTPTNTGRIPVLPSLEAELNDRVAHLYGLTAEEQKIVAGILPATPDGPAEEESE